MNTGTKRDAITGREESERERQQRARKGERERMQKVTKREREGQRRCADLDVHEHVA